MKHAVHAGGRNGKNNIEASGVGKRRKGRRKSSQIMSFPTTPLGVY